MLAHFGQDLHHADVLISSGFEVHSFGLSLEQFEQALRGIEFDAAIITCDERLLIESATLAVRSLSGTPIVVFEGVTDCAGLECDLVVPKLTHPSKWLPKLQQLIAQARQLKEKNSALRTEAQELRVEAANLRANASQIRAVSTDLRKEAARRRSPKSSTKRNAG